MRKMLSLTMSLLLFCCAFAQKVEKVGDYHNSYFEKEFDVYASDKTVMVYVAGERPSQLICLWVERDELTELSSFISLLKTKYLEWDSIASVNSITDFSKETPFRTPRLKVAWYGSKWWFSYKQSFQPVFKILDNGKRVMVITSKVKSLTNEYIDETFYMCFASKMDFDNLLRVIDPETIGRIKNQSKQVDNLFN